MFNQLIPINKEKLERPHIKWPLVSILALMLVSATLFFIDECQKMKIIFPVIEDAVVPVEIVTSADIPEPVIVQTYPTNDVTNRIVDGATSSMPDPEWPTADEMRQQVGEWGTVPSRHPDVQDETVPFAWPEADEMRDIVVGQ